jgi:hypothetical protein
MSAPNRFDSTEPGAPTLNNANGSLVTVLRAILRDGFSVKAITSITVAAGVATVVCPNHGYACGVAQLLRITGASVPLLNGDKQPTLVDTNTFTYPAPGVANGSYTATDARRAPLSWTEEFTDGNRSIFKRSAVEATGQMLYVQDNATAGATATHARFWGIETATDLDTYTGKFPTEVQLPGGFYWQKGLNSAAAKTWAAVGDDRFLWFMTEVSGVCTVVCFGDLSSYFPGDAYDCVVNGGTNNTAGTSAPSASSFTQYTTTIASGNSGGYVARGPNGSGTSLNCHMCGPGGSGSGVIGSGAILNEPQTHVPIGAPFHCMNLESSVRQIRGEYPGLAVPLATQPYAHLQIVTVSGGAGAGRRYQAFRVSPGAISGQFLIDLDGPWY